MGLGTRDQTETLMAQLLLDWTGKWDPRLRSGFG